MKKSYLYLILICSLPILLHVYNPSMKLGALGLFLGFWGLYISPIIIFGFLFYLILKANK